MEDIKMRLKKNKNLPKEEQIIKIEFKIKILIIIIIIWEILIISSAILLIIYTYETKLAFGFFISVPLSIYFGGYLQIKEYKEEISSLSSEE